MTSDRQQNYAVGYGKPPKQTQFKKGQGGNPRGRARGSAGFWTILTAILARRVTLTLNGKRKRVTVRDALVLQLIKGALSGNHQIMKILVDHKLAEKTKPLLIIIRGKDARL